MGQHAAAEVGGVVYQARRAPAYNVRWAACPHYTGCTIIWTHLFAHFQQQNR